MSVKAVVNHRKLRGVPEGAESVSGSGDTSTTEGAPAAAAIGEEGIGEAEGLFSALPAALPIGDHMPGLALIAEGILNTESVCTRAALGPTGALV